MKEHECHPHLKGHWETGETFSPAMGYGLQLKWNHVRRGCRMNPNPCPWAQHWAQGTGTTAELQPLSFSVQLLEQCNTSSKQTTAVTSQKPELQLLYTEHIMWVTRKEIISLALPPFTLRKGFPTFDCTETMNLPNTFLKKFYHQHLLIPVQGNWHHVSVLP